MKLTKQPRDQSNGRYESKNWDLMCKCGHKLGVHLALSPKECMECDSCLDFKKVKAFSTSEGKKE